MWRQRSKTLYGSKKEIRTLNNFIITHHKEDIRSVLHESSTMIVIGEPRLSTTSNTHVDFSFLEKVDTRVIKEMNVHLS